MLWALTIAGVEGVRALLESFRAEIVRVMAFCGARELGELTRDLIRTK